VAENTHQYDGFSVNLVLLETKIVNGSLTPSVHDRIEWVPAESLLDWKLAPADIPLAVEVMNLFVQDSK
jgi:8-oxo-dGTP diphosphatase